MEDELHKMIFDALPCEKADIIWCEIQRRENAQYSMYTNIIDGWRKRVEDFESALEAACNKLRCER